MTLANVTGLSAWVLVGAFAGLCLWAVTDYRRICKKDAERLEPFAEVVPAFDFHLARRPVASTRSGRAVQPADRLIHGGPRE